MPFILRAAWAVFRKDLRAELRTRYALNSLLLFAVCAITALSMGLGQLSEGRNQDLPRIQAGMLWIAILFAALTGLSRAFVHEEESRTALALRLAAPATAIYLGKLLFNLLLLLTVDTVILVLGVIFLQIRILEPVLLLGIVLAGSAGLASATTLIGAIIARASARGALFAVLSLPVLLPLLVVAIQGSAGALIGLTGSDVRGALLFLSSYTIATFTAALLLFRTAWEA